MTSNISYVERYKAGIHLLSHYSSMRTIVLSFLTPVLLGVAAIYIENLRSDGSDVRLLGYLFVFQAYLASCLLFSSSFFGFRIRRLREILIQMESDEGSVSEKKKNDVCPVKEIQSLSFSTSWKNFCGLAGKTDRFDMMIKSGCLVLELSLILFTVEKVANVRFFVA